MEFTFCQVSPFVARWRRMRLTDEDLQALEKLLAKRPDAGAVIGGTGGLRKLRFAPPSRAGGKSGGTRVIYGFFPEYNTIYLFLIYPKNEQADLTPPQKAQCRQLVAEIKRLLPGR